jgi:hypothetical protein
MFKSNSKIKQIFLTLFIVSAIGTAGLMALAGLGSLIGGMGSDCLEYQKIPGQILVAFADETAYGEAARQTKEMGLTPKVLGNDFAPIAFGDVGSQDPGVIEQKLQAYPEIEKVTIISGHSGIHAYFKFETDFQRVREIFGREGISFSDVNGPSIQQTTFLLLDVPEGKEKEYSDKFAKLPTVKEAAQHQRCVKPNPG